MKPPSLASILQVMQEKKYAVFEDAGGKGYDLNLVGIRSAASVPNHFDDYITLFYKSGGGWAFHAFPATTDPGLFWLLSPISRKIGTAIVKEGQYRRLWRTGFHKGRYEALVQNAPVTVIRDYDRDNQLDYDSGREETGMFGINLHRAHPERGLMSVDAWSAGCQVIQNPHHFDELMRVVHEGSRAYGNAFTYTLLHERDFA